MINLLRKEMKLSASALTYVFILFGLMFFLPGYPVLCGAFFISLGIFQSFQNTRETNDILFSALLPVAKKDVVKGKFLFVSLIELCGLFLMAVVVIFRMTLLANLPAYRNNALMNANGFALGLAFFIFGLFNLIFVSGFFKTAYKIAKPFILFCVVAFLTIGVGEALHHFPGLEALNAFGTDHLGLQLCLSGAGALLFVIMTYGAYQLSCRRLEKIDL